MTDARVASIFVKIVTYTHHLLHHHPRLDINRQNNILTQYEYESGVIAQQVVFS